VRDIKTFFRDLIKKPPQLFPLVALFHIAMLIYAVFADIGNPDMTVQIQVYWMLAYTIFWLFVCDMRKWAAIGYLLLTVTNLVLNIPLRTTAYSGYGSHMFILDVLFSFFLLFYYKRFD